MSRRRRPSSERRDAEASATAEAAPPPRQRIVQTIGAQVRTLRRSRELSVTELSSRAGISQGMLSKIERGQASPSIDTLAALAEVLDVPVARFLADAEDRRDCSVVRDGQGLKVERRGSRAGHLYQLLGHSLSGELFVEPYLVTTTGDAKPYSSFQHKGVEFLYVLEGGMSYRYADRRFELRPGDAMLFDATALHGPDGIEGAPVRYLSVVFNVRS